MFSFQNIAILSLLCEILKFVKTNWYKRDKFTKSESKQMTNQLTNTFHLQIYNVKDVNDVIS